MFFFVFRLIACVVLFIVYISLLFLIPDSWIGAFNRVMGGSLLSVCNFKRVRIKGFERFQKLVQSSHKFLIVSNHISLYDGFILLATLGNVGFLAHLNGMTMLPGMKKINKKLGSVFLDKKKGNTQSIIDHVNKRKAGENTLVVFPDAMEKVPKRKSIAPFRTGAFVGKFDVLPVVIKYKGGDIDPTFKWYDGEGFITSVMKMLIDGNCEILVEVMDLEGFSEDQDKGIEGYRDKIYDMMVDKYNRM